jgi:hypothetical protein
MSFSRVPRINFGVSLQENLAADVRVATERRLAAQEAELVRAETSRKERTMATRYHKVKFFGASSSSLHITSAWS